MKAFKTVRGIARDATILGMQAWALDKGRSTTHLQEDKGGAAEGAPSPATTSDPARPVKNTVKSFDY
jgi:hypothetical protein